MGFCLHHLKNLHHCSFLKTKQLKKSLHHHLLHSLTLMTRRLMMGLQLSNFFITAGAKLLSSKKKYFRLLPSVGRSLSFPALPNDDGLFAALPNCFGVSWDPKSRSIFLVFFFKGQFFWLFVNLRHSAESCRFRTETVTANWNQFRFC